MKRLTRKQLCELIKAQQYPTAVRIRIGEGYAYATPTCKLSRGGLEYRIKRWSTIDAGHAMVFFGPASLVVMPREKA